MLGKTVGFFQVVGHGIDKQLIDAMIIEAKRFFEKNEFQTLFFFTGRISLVLMHAIACSFDLDESYFDALLDDRPLGGAGTVSTLRLNYYPSNDNQIPAPVGVNDGQPLSCEAHCDGSILTLLYQHEVGGLQVKMKDGTWIDVPVVPYGLVINTSKCLER